MTRLKDLYLTNIVSIMIKEFKYSNIMEVPKIMKITLNMGVGKVIDNKKYLDYAVQDMTKISGQKPVITRAKKSLSSFKIREGWAIGCKVTLRKNRMYEFLDRLINIVLPRTRDFRGLDTSSFDGTGNYNLGIREQIIFPEINLDKANGIRGLNICITTSANSDIEAKLLLKSFNFPLK